jgi:hypothetical protein
MFVIIANFSLNLRSKSYTKTLQNIVANLCGNKLSNEKYEKILLLNLEFLSWKKSELEIAEHSLTNVECGIFLDYYLEHKIVGIFLTQTLNCCTWESQQNAGMNSWTLVSCGMKNLCGINSWNLKLVKQNEQEKW